MRIVLREAGPLAAVLLVAAVLLALWMPWLATIPAVLLLFTLWFFRDPRRVSPTDPDLLLSPADGRAIRVTDDRISVFLNIFNDHVCRTPLAGRVETVVHTRGRFLAAFKDEASEENERATIVISGGGRRVSFTLVAGLIARRILTWVGSGDRVEAGGRIGLIRFGSRVDVDLPPGASPAV